jgi:hypothetical protein
MLPRELGDRVDAAGVGKVVLGIWLCGAAVEDVVGREVDEPGSGVRAGLGQPLDGAHVDACGELLVGLALVDVVVGGAVEDDVRRVLRERLRDRLRVGDVEGPVVQRADVGAFTVEARAQVGAELPRGAGDQRPADDAHRSSGRDSSRGLSSSSSSSQRML